MDVNKEVGGLFLVWIIFWGIVCLFFIGDKVLNFIK